MQLIERDGFLANLQAQIRSVAGGEGHCILVSGEAGIGKTSLVRAFCNLVKDDCKIFQGSCDALFAPRPLAPLYDIALQMDNDLLTSELDISDRTALFSKFFRALSDRTQPVVIIFEDIHWADEATLDFVKFLVRRITLIHCLFILTYRDNEIHSRHPFRMVLGQLPPDSFTRLQLPVLSKSAVETMAAEKGYSGEDVYSISGGNPFYVTEILASYSPGVPDNIKDSILAVFNRHVETTKRVWEILSVLPTGIEVKYLEKLEPSYAEAIGDCLDSKILILKDEAVFFKHELYRRTVESSLSPFTRIALNKKILAMFREGFEQSGEIERIIHHAKNANEYDMVVHYAPIAARSAAQLGAHIEAAKLYYSAIEYDQRGDKDNLLGLYQSYAYECYLTNQIKDAIIFQGKALNILKEKGDPELIGNCMRFLSRLWWYDGNRKQAENFGEQAVELLDELPVSRAKAMAFSNMSQLKMLAGEADECSAWGEKAIAMARKLNDDEILSHALNNVGTVHMENPSETAGGVSRLQQSLDIALRNGYEEHAARAYTNLGSAAMKLKNYPLAKKILGEGIQYCEERELNSWSAYMLSNMARVNLETGHWAEARSIATKLVNTDSQSSIIKIGAVAVIAVMTIREGRGNVLPMLNDAKADAFKMMELQRIIPILAVMLEFEWITGQQVVDDNTIEETLKLMDQMGHMHEKSEFAYWLYKARKQIVNLPQVYEGYRFNDEATTQKAAELWEQLGCPYQQALALSEGDDEDKKKALNMINELGATAVYAKLKQEMRALGIRSIPRGIRQATRENPAFLTGRELDVLQQLKEGLQNKEIADRLFISAKTVDHHISSILLKLNVKSRAKAVQEAISLDILK